MTAPFDTLRRRAAQAGFSIVELMVGMTIGLIGTVVIFQTFEVSEGIKRSATSGGDAQQAGVFALYAIERDIRQAGFGLNYSALIGCDLNRYDTTAASNPLPTIKLVPVFIDATQSTAPSDAVSVIYGSSNQLVSSPKLSLDVNTGTAPLVVDYIFGFDPGNVVVVAESGLSCSMGQVSTIPAGTANIFHDTGTYTSNTGLTGTLRYNAPTGFPHTYTKSAKVFNLGSNPVRNTYYLSGTDLMLSSGMGVTTNTKIAENIVQLAVQYGKDTNADKIVDTYTATAPVAATDWAQVLAIRVAIVARSAQQEKPSQQGGSCDATANAPTWSWGTASLGADPNWRCYRYKTFETVVPIRNLIWTQA